MCSSDLGPQAFARELRTAVRTALVPTVDQTRVVGLIALPGTMTGLIIAGVEPLQAVQVQAEQASSAKMGAAVTVGAAIFGALLGRKTISAANLGRVSSAARGMSKIGKESEDVSRASQNVDALKAQLADLDASMQSDIQAVTADWDLANEPFERVLDRKSTRLNSSH